MYKEAGGGRWELPRELECVEEEEEEERVKAEPKFWERCHLSKVLRRQTPILPLECKHAAAADRCAIISLKHVSRPSANGARILSWER
jgi:hypothetical protein